MATKAQLVDYISENFETKDKMPVSLAKLDGYKKSELEKFISEKDDPANVEAWLESKKN